MAFMEFLAVTVVVVSISNVGWRAGKNLIWNWIYYTLYRAPSNNMTWWIGKNFTSFSPKTHSLKTHHVYSAKSELYITCKFHFNRVDSIFWEGNGQLQLRDFYQILGEWEWRRTLWETHLTGKEGEGARESENLVDGTVVIKIRN